MFVHVLNLNNVELREGHNQEFNEEDQKKGLVAANVQLLYFIS